MIETLNVGINFAGEADELRGCERDARRLAAGFPRKAGRKAREVAEFWGPVHQRRTLLGKRATRTRFLGAQLDAQQRPSEDERDLLITTISSHGSWIPDEDGEELDQRDESIVFADHRELINDEYPELVKQRPKKRVLFVLLDCCYGGIFPRRRARGNSGKFKSYRKPRHIRDRSSLLQQVAGSRRPKTLRRLPGVIPFSACLEQQVAYDGEFGGQPAGVMTELFLDAYAQLEPGDTFGYLFQILADLVRTPKYCDYDQQPNHFASDASLELPVPFLE